MFLRCVCPSAASVFSYIGRYVKVISFRRTVNPSLNVLEDFFFFGGGGFYFEILVAGTTMSGCGGDSDGSRVSSVSLEKWPRSSQILV